MSAVPATMQAKPALRADIVAGLTTAAVVIPKAMAYATIAGLPIEVGLYTAFVPMIVYAWLGTSRPLSVSTTTTIAILAGAELARVVPDATPGALLTATAMLTLLVGVFLLLAGILRLGFVADFISTPVLVGFKAGIGVVIVLDQLPKILGIHFDKGSLPHNVVEIVRGLGHVSWPTVAVGVGTIALLAAIERFRPRWPAPLVAIAVAIAGAGLMNWQAYGIELVGTVPQRLPALTMPTWSLAAVLWPAAAGIALMSFTETIAVGRAFQANDEPLPVANRELVATGFGNVAGAFFGAMPSGGGMSQTAVNRRSGARTQLSCVVTAATAVVTMLVLAPLIGLLPQASLAGVVIVYSIGLVSPADFIDIVRIRRTEAIWALVAFAGVMLLGTLKGILVAIVVSLVALAQQSADPPVRVLVRKRGTNVFRPQSDENADDEQFPGLLILRPEGRLFFLNAERVAERIRPLIAAANPRYVVLDLSAVFDLEYSALKALIDAEQRSRSAGVRLALAGLTPDVLEAVRRSPLDEHIGHQHMYFNVETAVARLQDELATAPPHSLPQEAPT
ncbi:SulP family inorganic anion transporter [Lysobacter sp. TY2-98]|uniref:SulP family inorganic anion transporter n=1 Tax=Lysobacter sp. TY2-98 TaxID=2290922 RepID=UPI000E2026B4|nr:SulP family inorganic anion transporter [Lysobacter sp. TY2-98]AXK71764.1 SulP family inorganic anion transporter [Lysobacter sp. TY2-98]